MADLDLEDNKKKDALVEYLQAPRKKRKNYVVLAVNPTFDADITSGIESFIKKKLQSVATVLPKNPKELLRLYSRQIVLLIIDDRFSNLEETIELVEALKQKKKNETIPVLFLTEHPTNLIEAYHKKLLVYQETDNYIGYHNIPLNQIYSRVQTALNLKEKGRKSKRFKIDIPIKYLSLSDNKNHEGFIEDISIHGALIRNTQDLIFKTEEQIKIHIPVMGLLDAGYGDFIRLSARIRQVYMGGNRAGISWEHITDSMFIMITKYVTELINHNMYLKSRREELRLG